MAHHKSAKKRIRTSAVARLRNRLHLTSVRAALKKLKANHKKEEASKLIPEVTSKIDMCVKHHIWHRNKGARLKSQVYHYVSKLV